MKLALLAWGDCPRRSIGQTVIYDGAYLDFDGMHSVILNIVNFTLRIDDNIE